MTTHETLGLMLVREGIIHRSQLYDALRLQRQNGRLLGTCLLSLGYIGADKLLQILAEQLQVPVLPPGSLKWASQEAVGLVPGELALKLRIVPYSYDGQMLGVAVADGRVLEHLHDVARQANAAVGAYIALEMEIEAALGKLYGHSEVAGSLQEPPEPLPGRPRPMRVQAVKEISSRDFGSALGIDDGSQPVVLKRPKSASLSQAATSAPATGTPPPASPSAAGSSVPAQSPPPAANSPPPAVSQTPASADPNGVTLPAYAPSYATSASPLAPRVPRGPPSDPPLERLSFFAAVEQIYAAADLDEIGIIVGQAMLNYFDRVMVFALRSRQLVLIGRGGLEPVRCAIALEAVPELEQRLGERNISYGLASEDERGEELCDMFGIDEAVTCFIASIASNGALQLLAYADNGGRTELYEDLHDVELLFKETETALEMLGLR